MDRQDLIARIKEINISATDEFLKEFDTESLQRYLERLEDTYGKKAKAVVLTAMSLSTDLDLSLV